MSPQLPQQLDQGISRRAFAVGCMQPTGMQPTGSRRALACACAAAHMPTPCPAPACPPRPAAHGPHRTVPVFQAPPGGGQHGPRLALSPHRPRPPAHLTRPHPGGSPLRQVGPGPAARCRCLQLGPPQMALHLALQLPPLLRALPPLSSPSWQPHLVHAPSLGTSRFAAPVPPPRPFVPPLFLRVVAAGAALHHGPDLPHLPGPQLEQAALAQAWALPETPGGARRPCKPGCLAWLACALAPSGRWQQHTCRAAAARGLASQSWNVF